MLLSGCTTTKAPESEQPETPRKSTSDRRERYRHSTQMGSWFMEKKAAPVSEADAAASRTAFEEAQRRGMRPVRDGGS